MIGVIIHISATTNYKMDRSTQAIYNLFQPGAAKLLLEVRLAGPVTRQPYEPCM